MLFGEISLIPEFLKLAITIKNSEEIKMKTFQNNNYALNKFSENIIYIFQDELIEITLEQFLFENPTATEDDFIYWKELSDELLYEEDRSNWRQTHKNYSLDLMEHHNFHMPSPEDLLIEQLSLQEANLVYQENKRKLPLVLNSLTETQKRRYLLYICAGMTERAIASSEGVSQQSIHECLVGVEKKISKLLKKIN